MERHNTRLVKKAATDDQMFGQFYEAKPDFEFDNFEMPELAQIAKEMALQNGAPKDIMTELTNSLARATKSKKFMEQLPGSAKPYVNKSEKWGELLMEYAAEKPEFSNGQRRPIIQAIQDALLILDPTRNINYRWHWRKFRTDPQTGKIVERLELFAFTEESITTDGKVRWTKAPKNVKDDGRQLRIENQLEIDNDGSTSQAFVRANSAREAWVKLLAHTKFGKVADTLTEEEQNEIWLDIEAERNRRGGKLDL
jgi:hypothetical protein